MKSIDIKQAVAIKPNLIRVNVEIYDEYDEIEGYYELAITSFPGDTDEQVAQRIVYAIRGMEDTFARATELAYKTITVDEKSIEFSILPGYDKATGE